MFRPRVIPVILVDGRGHAVKTVGFRKPLDLGDPVNIVSLFNAFEVDELVVLDIAASAGGYCFPDRLMADIAAEARMPLAVGGGIRSCDDIHRLLHAGAEKVVLRTAAMADLEFVRTAAARFASSSISVCLDVTRDWRGRYRVLSAPPETKGRTPASVAQAIEAAGAGELLVQSVERDGRMDGYDLDLVGAVADAVGIPVVALGGAGTLEDLRSANAATYASAFAAGSLFCFQDHRRGVLINYPDREQLASLGRPA